MILSRDFILVEKEGLWRIDCYLVKLSFCRDFMVEIEFNLISCEFGGRLMDGFVLIGIREHWCV